MLKKIATLPYLKMCITMLTAGIVFSLSGRYDYALFATLELLLITLMSEWISLKSKLLAWFLNSFLTLCVLAEGISWLFAGSYITAIMVGNIVFISSLGNKLPTYLAGAAFVILISFYPIFFPKRTQRKTSFVKKTIGLFSFLGLVTLITLGVTNKEFEYSSVNNIFFTGREVVESKYKAYQLKQAGAKEIKRIKKEFAQAEIEGAREKPETLPDKPNIVVIWAEGMSQETIDGNISDLMPNVKAFQEESLSFTNYYNHTAATVRGLRGQMTSGYQYSDHDVSPEAVLNSPLISIQGILGQHDYSTTFINPEPTNMYFTSFLESLGYDQLLAKKLKNRDATDEEMFELMLKTVDKKQDPFFIGMYTFGTHHGHDSDEIKYGDGSDEVLNRWANFDYAFGEFYEQFKESDAFDDTILILTTDHASYPSPEYQTALKSSQQTFISEIPLIISYNGVPQEQIDANGRNSLTLTPTILDLIDMEDEKNYFLGTSLFNEHSITPYEHLSVMGEAYYSTTNNTARKLDASDPTALMKKVADFSILAENE